jgi:HEAT repeat protein
MKLKTPHAQFGLFALAVTLAAWHRCAAAEQNPGPGEESTQARLKRIIHDTIKTTPILEKPNPAEADSLKWSPAVNGLVARIEFEWGYDYLLRLKNISREALTVPIGNPIAEGAAQFFQVEFRQGASPWTPITGMSRFIRFSAEPLMGDAPPPGTRRPREQRRRLPWPESTDRPWVTLQPGEDCIALVSGFPPVGNGEPQSVRVLFRRKEPAAQGEWRGTLETPARPIRPLRGRSRAFVSSLPFPTQFPGFSYQVGGVVMAEPPDASSVRLLQHSNLPLIDALSIYQPAGVCREFEQRFRAERIEAMKFLEAGIAAGAGSEEAALFLLETSQRTDVRSIQSLRDALLQIYLNYEGLPDGPPRGQPPKWLNELALAIVSDNRPVTQLPNGGWTRDTTFAVAEYSKDLLTSLVYFRYPNVLPLLERRVQKDDTDWRAWQDLAKFDEKRAIAGLIKAFKKSATVGMEPGESVVETDFMHCAGALSALKAREAAPVLLAHIEYPEIIGYLAEIGDPRVAPALNDLVAAHGKLVRNGKPIRPEFETKRLFAARFALARFDPPNEVPRLGELLADPKQEHRYDVVMRLERLQDPRVTPLLIKVIKTDSDYYILEMAIGALGERKEKAAVEGLIDCFDVAFRSEDVGKGEHVTPATYRNRIAASLQRITGESFGADKQQWLKWWHEKGASISLH